MENRPSAVRIDRVDSDVVLAVSGEVDINGATELKRAFDEIAGHSGKVIIDLLLVSFMDSMGLGTLIDGRNRLESDGAAVLLVSDNGPAGRLLALTKLDESFPVFDSVESARDAS
ncbi:MAG: STAS domain-containing protein [Acidimicrobiia bacterium]